MNTTDHVGPNAPSDVRASVAALALGFIAAGMAFALRVIH